MSTVLKLSGRVFLSLACCLSSLALAKSSGDPDSRYDPPSRDEDQFTFVPSDAASTSRDHEVPDEITVHEKEPLAATVTHDRCPANRQTLDQRDVVPAAEVGVTMAMGGNWAVTPLARYNCEAE